MKVKTHLAVMAAAAIIPVVVFSAIVMELLVSAERKASSRSMHELARATMFAIDQEMTAALATAKTLSTSGLLLEEDLLGFYLQAKKANQGREAYAAVLSEDGQQLFNTIAEFGKPVMPPMPENRARAAAALAENTPQISGLIRESTTQKYVVGVEIPVHARGGKGYVVGEWMFASHLNGILPRQGVPASWIIGVFDKAGRTLSRNHGPADYIGQFPQKALLEAIAKGSQSEYRTTTREGVDVYGVIAKSDLTGWTVTVGVPVAEVEEASRHAGRVALLGLLAALCCATLAAAIFGRRLAEAVDGATRSAVLLGTSKMPPLAKSPVEEVNKLYRSLHAAGKLIRQADADRDQHLAEAESARKLAEAQNKAKDEFLAMLGHELRNPLAAISAGATLLKQEDVPDLLTRRARDIIERQSQHLTSLVNDLLDAHRVMTGKVSLTRQRLSFEDCVTSCIEVLEARGATAQHTVRVHTEPVFVDADPDRLEQMVTNLVSNALKYTPEGGMVDVSLEREGDEAVMTVRDNGVGIAPELLPRIFDVFVQGEVSNRSKGGLGIGLAIVHSLARRHGATITAESAGIGQGSTFTLRFPVSDAEAVESAGAEPGCAGGALRVLVVEDNDDTREMLCALLGTAGHTVESAANGRDAVELALGGAHDVALIDIDLPDISGYDIVAQLRSDERTAHKPLFAVTGYGQEADRNKALAHGFDKHLTKPVNAQQLMAELAAMAPARRADARAPCTACDVSH